MNAAGHLPAYVQQAGVHAFIRCINPEDMDWTAPFFRDSIPASSGSHSLVPLADWRLRQPEINPDYTDVSVIFHVSRCGSTLLARNIAATGQVEVLSEPPFFASLHGRFDAITGDAERMTVSLALLEPWRNWASARGKRLVLKLSSQLNSFIPAVIGAMPGARFAALHRDPLPVLESLDRKRTSRLQKEAGNPPQMLPGALRGLDDDRYLLAAADRYLGSLGGMQAASDILFAVDYENLGAHYPHIMEHFRIDPGVSPAWSGAINAKASGSAVKTAYRPVSKQRLDEFAAAHSRLIEFLNVRYARFRSSPNSGKRILAGAS